MDRYVIRIADIEVAFGEATGTGASTGTDPEGERGPKTRSDPGTTTTTQTVFHYKYLPTAPGDIFRCDPTLVAVDTTGEFRRIETGEASLAFEGTR